MIVLLRMLLITALGAPGLGIAGTTGEDPRSNSFRVHAETGLLTIETRGVPLLEILREIGEQAGFETVVTEDYVEPPRISVTYEDIPIRDAVERLVSGSNRLIFYSPGGDGSSDFVISQVWLLGPSVEEERIVGDGDMGEADDLQNDDGGIRSKAVLRLANQPRTAENETGGEDRALSRLIQIIQSDQDALVRTRAAMALGALRDQDAVPALEAALMDQHPTVRSQVINALGQVGGERAIEILGNLLLYGSTDKTERIIAAQALWKHDTEVAQRYLRAGAYDTDEQVRLASSKAPVSPKERTTTDQLGAAEAQ